MVPVSILNAAILWLQENIDETCRLITYNPVGGGSINESLKLKTSCGTCFLKYNDKDRYPGMFEFELKGLELLANSGTVYVPRSFAASSVDDFSYLLLDYEQSERIIDDYWKIFGKQLAALHTISSDEFGLEYDNYIGSLKQPNERTKDLYGFLINQRFQPLVSQAFSQGFFTSEDLKSFERLFKRLPELIPDERPSLIHGDLWSGNIIANHVGSPCLIDPAVYYGNRESDIAMSRLFGGFPGEFYDSYNYYNPLISEWQERIELFQLYPLLVHVILFGGGYASQVKRIIQKY